MISDKLRSNRRSKSSLNIKDQLMYYKIYSFLQTTDMTRQQMSQAHDALMAQMNKSLNDLRQVIEEKYR